MLERAFFSEFKRQSCIAIINLKSNLLDTVQTVFFCMLMLKSRNFNTVYKGTVEPLQHDFRIIPQRILQNIPQKNDTEHPQLQNSVLRARLREPGS